MAVARRAGGCCAVCGWAMRGACVLMHGWRAPDVWLACGLCVVDMWLACGGCVADAWRDVRMLRGWRVADVRCWCVWLLCGFGVVGV